MRIMIDSRLRAGIILLAVSCALLLPERAAGQASAPRSAAEIAAYQGADRERILVEGARREGKLSWYTTLAANQNNEIARAFEARYPGVKVDVFRTGSGPLIER